MLFSCISSQFSSPISIAFLIWSIHLVLGLPLGHFPSIFVCSIFLSILSSLIHFTCLNHPYLLFWIYFWFHSPLVPILVEAMEMNFFLSNFKQKHWQFILKCFFFIYFKRKLKLKNWNLLLYNFFVFSKLNWLLGEY